MRSLSDGEREILAEQEKDARDCEEGRRKAEAPEVAIESWRVVFRDGLAPHLSDAALAALENGLATDDPSLTQGSTTTPPPLSCVQDWPCEGGCLIAYSGWKGEGLSTVGDVSEYFARICFEIDRSTREAASCRHLLNWFDDTPREVMLAELLGEVRREIRIRKEKP